MDLNIIVCHCNKNGIGKSGSIPWRIRDDLRHFRFITTSSNDERKNVVIMGRNTWLSLPKEHRPLTGRINMVLSSKKRFEDSDKVDYIGSSLENMLEYISKEDIYTNIYIIGGEQIYKYVLDNYESMVNNIYVTELYSNVLCDKFFPDLNKEVYKLTKAGDFKEESGMTFRYLVYQNIEKLKALEYKDIYINREEQQYKNLIRNILDNGQSRDDRTGVGTLSIFAPYMMKYDLSNGNFPACTLKRAFMKGIFEELMLYIRGQTDNKILNEKKVHIWDGNTTREFLDGRGLKDYPEGDMGETYGFNMRHYGGKYVNCKTKYDKNEGFDQLEYVLNEIKNNPHSRRILINLWNPKTTCNAALPSCLHQYQFYVDTKNKRLDLQIYLRSSDVFLANNWNTITGALFVHLICNLNSIKLSPGVLTVVCGDAHIYKNHIELCEKMLLRDSYPFPTLLVKKKYDKLESFNYEDIQLVGYKAHPADLKGEMAV